MSLWDRLMGRGKKATGDLMGDKSMTSEGMHQEQEGMAKERAEQADETAQQARDEAAEHRSERSDSP
jgi:uncharacterized protein YjbJ (UPF0337 family)